MTEAWLEELDLPTCLRLLAENFVGRIAVIADDYPIVLPVNYRLVASSEANWLAVRTRPGSVLDRGPLPVAFEIDAIDPAITKVGRCSCADTCSAWIPTQPTSRFDPEPWLVSDATPGSWSNRLRSPGAGCMPSSRSGRSTRAHTCDTRHRGVDERAHRGTATDASCRSSTTRITSPSIVEPATIPERWKTFRIR